MCSVAIDYDQDRRRDQGFDGICGENERSVRQCECQAQGHYEQDAEDGRADGCWLEGLVGLFRLRRRAFLVRVVVLKGRKICMTCMTCMDGVGQDTGKGKLDLSMALVEVLDLKRALHCCNGYLCNNNNNNNKQYRSRRVVLSSEHRTAWSRWASVLAIRPVPYASPARNRAASNEGAV